VAAGASPARLALMKDQTPVPWRLSVAPTAYRDASNAVLMDQKIVTWGLIPKSHELGTRCLNHRI